MLRLQPFRNPTYTRTHVRLPHRQFGTSSDSRFRLEKEFVDQYRNQAPPFGFNGLGELVYKRSYSRVKPNKSNEEWFETVERVVNGTYHMQKSHIEANGLPWDSQKAQLSAQEMYRRIFEMKFLPPGRGLWAMGTDITEERGLYAALNNCAFVSTEALTHAPSKPFAFLMDMAMLGVGVGFDTNGANQIRVERPSSTTNRYVIPDSREGWVESVKLLLDSYLTLGNRIEFDYSLIRGPGVEIKGFGGISSGPAPLKELHAELTAVLEPLVGSKLTLTSIVDIMNLIGKCVVSGNVRRTAEIAFGDATSEEYIDLKDYTKNPARAAFGWTSNNSVYGTLGMDYTALCHRITKNGEPGIAWLENMQKYSRMGQPPDNKDYRVRGGNPCLEQSLEPYELCCLVETFPHKHDTLEDFKKTLSYAFLYAKTVTLGRSHWPESNTVMLRNRRIGTSMSGIAQFITSRGLDELKEWCQEGYDHIQAEDTQFSEWLAIPKSVKTTCIKPSGTVSLLAGATPGMHYPISESYIRRVRMPHDSPLLAPLKASGHNVEPAHESPDKTVVVDFPITVGKGIRKASEVSMWEQMSLAAFLQKYWADNQVSCTVTFDPNTEAASMKDCLNYFQYQLKGISLLPNYTGVYQQMPYESISEDVYHSLSSKLTPTNWKGSQAAEPVPEKFCDASSCTF
eukprot:TRINITY_DN9434_c0_g1_i1.p1 TRINITY_DN9434_c0_g1~~TRINITY_DN9434_c0_g1_i1.p1  ORF type:complete len:681 (-),score=139.37 TRINITY_DN9434_c0_g1_i1:226-2268(-)